MSRRPLTASFRVVMRRLWRLVFDEEPVDGVHPFIGIPLVLVLATGVVWSAVTGHYVVTVVCAVVIPVLLVSVVNAFRSGSWIGSAKD